MKMRVIALAIGVALLLSGSRSAAGFEVLVEVKADLASMALDRSTGTIFVFTAAYDNEPIPSSGLITEYRRDGVPVTAYLVPEPVIAQGGRKLGYDPNRQLFILGGADGQEDPTSDFTKAGQIVYTYSFVEVTGAIHSGSTNGVDIDKRGNRYYSVGAYDPAFVVEIDPGNLHEGRILSTEAKVLFAQPLALYAGGFSRDFKSGKFLLASGSKGEVVEFNKKGRELKTYSLSGLGFGRAFYQGADGGYFIDNIALESDGSLLVGAAYRSSSDVYSWRVLRFAKSEWRALRISRN